MIDEKKLIEYIDAGHYRSAFEKVFSENDVVNMIKKQPKISLENKTSDWISVEEALPNEKENVLVSTNELNIEMAYYSKGKFMYDHDEFGVIDWWYDEDKVIAWQPLPKPYKSER